MSSAEGRVARTMPPRPAAVQPPAAPRHGGGRPRNFPGLWATWDCESASDPLTDPQPHRPRSLRPN